MESPEETGQGDRETQGAGPILMSTTFSNVYQSSWLPSKGTKRMLWVCWHSKGAACFLNCQFFAVHAYVTRIEVRGTCVRL